MCVSCREKSTADYCGKDAEKIYEAEKLYPAVAENKRISCVMPMRRQS